VGGTNRGNLIGFTTFVSENLWWMAVAEFGSITISCHKNVVLEEKA
jgi:hypothetical protein